METSETPSRGESAGIGDIVPSPPPPLKLNLVDCTAISVDTNNFVDIPQQDSGSNQSGSDSGLGYTNSISSDNSILNTPVGQDQTKTTVSTTIRATNKDNISAGSINESISVAKAGEGGSTLDNIGRSTATITPTTTSTVLSPSSSSFKSSTSNNTSSSFNKHNIDGSAFLCTKSKSDSERTRIKPSQDNVLDKQTTSAIKHSYNHKHKHHINDIEVRNDVAAATAAVDGINKNDGVKTSQADDIGLINNESVTHQTRPIIKSVLRKTPYITGATGPKHNRNVTFNQTVIVFCEEMGTSSPVDQYEPPSEYQDVLSAFEPPEDYCDHSRDRAKDIDLITLNQPKSSMNGVSDTLNLTDEQLFGLLEKDPLLNSFKLSCDDLSDEDFPVNQLNSGNSYLCNDAISDYDSDSESSNCLESTRQPQRAVSNKQKPNSIPSDPLRVDQNHNRVRPNSSSQEESRANDIINHKNDSVLQPDSSKSMPARMKVTTFDQKLSKKINIDETSIKTSNDSRHVDVITKERDHCNQMDSVIAAPLIIKQTILRPVAISKPTIRSLDYSDFNKSPSHDNVSKNREQIGSGNERRMINTQTNTAEAQYVNQVGRNINHQNTSDNHLDFTEQNNQSCQVCKAIESNKVKPTQVYNNNLPRIRPATSHQSNSVIQTSQPIHIITNQPPVYNQSCTSCREASSGHNDLISKDFVSSDSSSLAPKPVAYQLVYVVDQHGNRMRALSMLTPNQLGQPMQNRRIFVAQNNIRFPNPVSINGPGQAVNIPNTANDTIRTNQNSETCSTQRYSSEHVPAQQNVHLNNPKINLSQNFTVIPGSNTGLRQHTVYYVRQPLDTHNLNELPGKIRSNLKSFPDPHEVRRLDGLRAPTASVNIDNPTNRTAGYKHLSQSFRSIHTEQISDHEQNSRTESVKEDLDDPTFGFSKRPAVKVVSCSNPPYSSNSKFGPKSNVRNSELNGSASYGETITVRRLPESRGPAGSVPYVITGSQTLGRRQNQMQKEFIPSTSSMSNIHRSLVNDVTNRVSNTTQQQRISVPDQEIRPRKGMSSLKRILNKLTR